MKKAFAVLSFILLFFFFSFRVHAENSNFEISSNSSYIITEAGRVRVTQKIQIKNTTDIYYAPSYTIILGIKNASNFSVSDADGKIPFIVQKNDEETKINITFTKRIAGVGKINAFTFYYETDSIAKKNGTIWEVVIPGLSNPDDFTSYTVTISTPQNFGPPSIVKPYKKLSQGTVFSFTKDELATAGINILFGSEQYYKATLTYHLNNKNLFPIKTEIALPPDTNYQDVLIESINPQPTNVTVDPDGNYLAAYDIAPQKKIDVVLIEKIKVHNPPEVSEISSDAKPWLKSDKFWDVSNTTVQNIVSVKKDPYSIYNYVSETLSYNYDKVNKDNQRLGAAKVLSDPKNAVCLEFTDLFVTLARAAKIPARAVEGYAYTDNSRLKPLSLVRDVLHAWPEYYDAEKKAWIMIDPTWANTTKGIDYFSDFDFEHIAFVVKGIDSNYPIPAGGYKNDEETKDVSIEFTDPSAFTPKSSFTLKSTLLDFYLSGFSIKGAVQVYNNGNTILKNKTITVTSDISDKKYTFTIDSLPPFGSKFFTVDLGTTPFLTSKYFTARMQMDTNILNQKIHVNVFPESNLLYIGGGIFVSVILISIIALKTWRLFVQRQQQEDIVRGESKGS